MSRVSLLLLASAMSLVVAHPAGAAISRSETLAILGRTRFRLVRHVRDLPVDVFRAAGLIPHGRTIDSFIVDPGKDYQQHPASVDLSKAASQLIFAGISDKYIVCSFWAGGLTEAEHVILLRRDGHKANLLLHTVVYPEARDIVTLRKFLARERWEPFVVATEDDHHVF